MFLAKILSSLKSTASNNFLKPNAAITAPHVPRHLTLLPSRPSPAAPSTKSPAGKPRPQTTRLGVEKKEPPTQADKMRSSLLDRSQSILVGVEESAAVGETRNHRGVASSALRTYWRLKCKVGQAGRKAISAELQQTTFRMAREIPTWGTPRIHGELLMLGYDVSGRSISGWMGRCSRPDPTRRWLAFLATIRKLFAAMDFVTVPPITGTCESYVSNEALLRQGKKMWRRHVADVVIQLRAAA